MLVACLATVGCGSSPNSVANDAAQARVALAMHSYLNALAHSDYPRVCSLLAEDARIQLHSVGRFVENRSGKAVRNDCPDVLATLRPSGPGLEEAPSAEVTRVEVEGAQASVVYRIDGRSYSLGMTRENGVWKATMLSMGTPAG